MSEKLKAGVIGVGSMGENHVRVYRHLPEADLCGVTDAVPERAEEVAEKYDTEAVDMATLLDRADVVSVAVPTQYHYDTVRECIDAGVHVLVEKPFVDDIENGRSLIEFANDRGVTLQVGHIERFNPAVRALADVVDDLDIIAVNANRLSPPLDREIDDSAVMDLMIHDLDILASLVDSDATDIRATGVREGRYASATVEFESGVVGQLTASRVTQEKVRELTITAESCRVTVDYIGQSIQISRQSTPEYIRDDANVHYHHESIVEELTVENREPLKHELESFLEAVRTGSEPVVTAEDGLQALALAREIDALASEEGDDHTVRTPVSSS